jgi:DNA-binding transcriptional LysR family regulator
MTDVLGLDDTARRLRGAAGDTFMLGTGSGMAQLFMPRLFGQFDRVPAELRLEIVTAPTRNIFRELQDQRLDAGIALDSDPEKVPAGVIVHQLAAAELAIIAHPRHRIAAAAPPIDIGGLVGEPIIMSELTVGYGDTVMAMFSDLGIRPHVLAVADNIETMKVIVQSGTGIAIVPRAAVANELALGVLVALAITPPRAVRFSLFRRRQAMSRRKEDFFTLLKDVLGDPPGG